jgi:ATP-dependent Lhr-like helicase
MDLDMVLPVSKTPHFSGKLPAEFFDIPRSFWEIKDALIQNKKTQEAGLSAVNDAGISSTAQALWDEVWSGNLSADSWEPIRRALESGFASAEPVYQSHSDVATHSRRAQRLPRAIRERWRTGAPVKGNWFSLNADDMDSVDSWDYSPLEEEELNRERVRLLLARWGILARPFLEREEPLLSWSRLLPAMRRMELAGELVVGRVFSGINSLQFASPRIAEELEEAETERGIFWMNAADPASPAGLAIEGITAHETSIRRIPSTRLCYRGTELLAISNRGGKELEILISPDDPDIAEALVFLKIPKTRRVQPETKIVIEKINGITAAKSVYASALAAMGFVKDRGKLVLW